MKPVIHDGIYTLQDRLNLIAERVELSVTHPQKRADGSEYMLITTAEDIVKDAPQHGNDGEDAMLATIFSWVVNHIRYRPDMEGYDYYRSAGRTLIDRAGDCDCHMILCGALLRTLGFRVGARICSPDRSMWHIYLIAGAHPALAPTIIYPFDTTQPGSYVGWEPPASQRRYLYQCAFHYDRAISLRPIRK